MYKGVYKGKILRINLTKQSAVEEEVSEELIKKYLNGTEFAIEYVYDEVKAKTPPLDPDKKLIFTAGPLMACGTACSSRVSLVSKSPPTWSTLPRAPISRRKISRKSVKGSTILPGFSSIREGFTRKDDTFPKRLITETIKDGASEGQLIGRFDLATMLDEYHRARGCDKEGNQDKTKPEELARKT